MDFQELSRLTRHSSYTCSQCKINLWSVYSMMHFVSYLPASCRQPLGTLHKPNLKSAPTWIRHDVLCALGMIQPGLVPPLCNYESKQHEALLKILPLSYTFCLFVCLFAIDMSLYRSHSTYQ